MNAMGIMLHTILIRKIGLTSPIYTPLTKVYILTENIADKYFRQTVFW